MAIEEYQSIKGKTLYRVSVVRKSTKVQGLRVHKQLKDIESKTKAVREEKRLIERARYDISEKEHLGCSWGKLVEAYEEALLTGRELSRQVTKSTLNDYSQILRQWTKVWWARPASQIGRADVKEVLNFAEDQGRSISRVKKIRNVINGTFNFGIDSGRIRNIQINPASKISLKSNEETKQKVLTLADIRKLLEISRSLTHPWFPVWAFALHTSKSIHYSTNKLILDKAKSENVGALRASMIFYLNIIFSFGELLIGYVSEYGNVAFFIAVVRIDVY